MQRRASFRRDPVLLNTTPAVDSRESPERSEDEPGRIGSRVLNNRWEEESGRLVIEPSGFVFQPWLESAQPIFPHGLKEPKRTLLLEDVREAEVGLIGFFVVGTLIIGKLGLEEARAAIDGGALGERVFVLKGGPAPCSTSRSSS